MTAGKFQANKKFTEHVGDDITVLRKNWKSGEQLRLTTMKSFICPDDVTIPTILLKVV